MSIATDAATIETIHALVDGLDGWTLEKAPTNSWNVIRATLLGTEGRLITVTARTDESHWELSASVPGEWRRDFPRTTIRQTYTRPMSTLLADVRRRLLEPYEETFARWQALTTAETAQDQANHDVLVYVADRLPGAHLRDRNENRDGRPEWRCLWSRPRELAQPGPELSAVVQGTRTSIELTWLTPQQVRAVADAIAPLLTA